MVKNSAFVFIKPHAVTDKVKELVKETLEAKGIEIKKEGSIEAEEIDKKMLIDKHYYAIAAKATLKKPTELPIPKDKFKDKFGLEWDDVVKEGKTFNAKDACEHLEIDSAKLDELWAAAKKAGKLVKFGGGFYCGLIESGDKSIYVFNGFFMAMRSKFVTPGVSIYFYIVEWDAGSLEWADFRGKVLGPTDPADAPADSLRGLISSKWQDLGLKEPCNTGDNGVHASASPFEALAERMNWLGYRVERDQFGKVLLKAGVSISIIKEWSADPQVTFGVSPIKKSLFDTLEDTDSDYCAALCQLIASYAEPAKPKASPLEKEAERLKAELAKYEEIAKAVATIQSFTPPAKAVKAEAKADAKSKAKAKAKSKPKAGKETSPELKELLGQIREMRKTMKKEGKSKEESDEQVKPLLEKLREARKKDKVPKAESEGEAPKTEDAA